MARGPLFDMTAQGEQAITGDTWIDLGLIPDETQLMFGFATYSPEGKALTFALRSNKVGKSAGTTTDTTIHDKVRVKDGDSRDRDYYKNARTARKSVVSTGVEHFWLFLDMKGAASVDVWYWIDYVEI